MAWNTSPRHGTNWKPKGYAKLRAERFAAHVNRCLDCGHRFADNELELDHLNGDRNDWRPENLGPRCPPCHDAKTQTEAAAARRRQSPKRPSAAPHPGLRPSDEGVGGAPLPTHARPR